MILAGPPAVAITYEKDSRGLSPSLYGGGGSPSSRSLLDEPSLSLVSRGSAALVSATASEAAEDDGCPEWLEWPGGQRFANAGKLSFSPDVTCALFEALVDA